MSSASPRHRAAVVMVTCNSGPDVRRAVESIHRAAAMPVETVVVDHASNDGSIEDLRSRHPDVRVLGSDSNPGFAAGCNRGIAATEAPLVLLLNPDTALRPGALETMAGYLERHPRVGVVGPRLLNPDGSLQTSAYRTPGLLTEAARLTGLASLAPRRAVRASHPLRRLLPDTGHFDPHDRTREVDFVTGACMLVRRAVLEELGGFDEEYFLYYEEIDLCLRAREGGWRIVHLPRAEAVHTVGGSSRRARRVAWAARHLSRQRFHALRGGSLRAGAIRVLGVANIAGRLLVESMRLPFGVEPDRIGPRDCLRVLGAVIAPSRRPVPACSLPAWLGP